MPNCSDASIAQAACAVAADAARTRRVRDARGAYRFGIEEGWAVNILAVPGVPLSVAKAVARYGLRQCEYPFKVTQVIEIFEAGPAGATFD